MIFSEGDNVFGLGSRTPIAITFLVRNSSRKKDGIVHYCDIGDYLSRDEKLNILKNNNNIDNVSWFDIKPDDNNDWINKTNPVYNGFMLLGSKEKQITESVLWKNKYAIGLFTSRDSIMYSFSNADLRKNACSMINAYNDNIDYVIKNKVYEKDLKNVNWSAKLNNLFNKREKIDITSSVTEVLYRPFCKEYLYNCEELIERPGLWRNIIGSFGENLSICMVGSGGTKDFSCIISNKIADLQLMSNCQCFPLYWYEKKASYDLFSFDNEEYSKEYAISDAAFDKFKEKYGQYITKEDLFYYIFGVLNSKKYQELYADNLKKEMPRIPFLNHFDGYVKTAKKLADLELNYESIPYLSSVLVEKKSENYKVSQMKFAKDGKNVDKSTIIFNESITVKNIPLEAYEYIVNGKSAIEWIMERYCVSQDKASGIINDCNKYSDDPKYVLNLLLSIISMSVKINDTIKELPEYEEI